MAGMDEVLTLMQEVAAEVIDPRFRALAAGEVDQKNPGDYVTIADRESELLLTAALPKLFPGAVVVGEEASFLDPAILDRLQDEHVFLVDPVDGTMNFVKGSPNHGVMVAELQRGEAVRSWIWQPQHGVAYLAERGAGARRRNATSEQALRAAAAPDQPRGSTSKRSRLGFDADGQLAPVVSSIWCVALDYPRVVEGQLDYLVYKNLKPWDHVPCTLLLREAGGVAITFDGDDYRPASAGPGLVAAVSPEVAQLVVDTWQEP